MNKITERLSSLNFAVWTLIALLMWFVWGLVLAADEDFFNGFRQMNSILVRDWLLESGRGLIHLKVWFIGLCLVMVVMGVNLVFCSWNRILKIMRHRFSGPKLFMLIVHMIFGFVALGHFGGFMLGYRYGDVPLKKGEVFSFEQGFELKVTDVHFEDDPKVLAKSRREIMRNEFHYERNFAEVALFQEERLLLQDRVYLLSPLSYGNLQITLKRFLSPKDGGKTPEGLPGVMLSVSSNPVLKAFLCIYPMMILGIAIHLIMTWQQPEKGREHG
ncbi:MAG: hypothetical protein GY846_06460 [Deltaproteobacteria bacterium]|nr:hypothetical protein [Deltaproteobacteria bacterium]